MQKKTQDQFNQEAYFLIIKMIKSRSKKYRSFLEQMTLTKDSDSDAIDILISDFYADVFLKNINNFYETWCVQSDQFIPFLSKSITLFFISKHRSLSRVFYGHYIYETIKEVAIEIGEEKILTEKAMVKDNIDSLLKEENNTFKSEKELKAFIPKFIQFELKINIDELKDLLTPYIEIDKNPLKTMLIKEAVLTEETMGIDIFSILAESKIEIIAYHKNKKGNKINKKFLKKFLKEDLMPLCNHKINIGEIKEAILKCHPSLGPSNLKVEPGTQNDETENASNDIDTIEDKQNDKEFFIDSQSDLNPALYEMNERLEVSLFREKLKKQNQYIEEKILDLHMKGYNNRETSELLAKEGIELDTSTVWRKLEHVKDQLRKHIKN